MKRCWHGDCFTSVMMIASRPLPLLLLVLAGCLASAGCTATGLTTNSSPSTAQWVKRQGGIVTDHHQVHAEAALATLKPALGDVGRSFQVRVLATDALTAFAWPSGELYVSRGLVTKLTPDELAAAIAHEAAHILADESPMHPSALAGSSCAHDHEAHADALGTQLLKQSGIPAKAMTSMLHKVKDAQPMNSPVRMALQKRISALR